MIHLAIAFDKNYLAPFYALVNSIFQNNKHEIFTIHLIVSGLNEEEKKQIQEYIKEHNSAVAYYDIDEETVRKFVLTSKFTPAAYYRLYFPLLMPLGIDRLVYLDTDTLVINKLAALYTAELDNYPVGAVYDNWVKTAPQLGITDEEAYFNSGVLVIDIKKWNQQKISEQSFTYLSNYPERIIYVDQDALNAVLKDNWKRLDDRFNFMYSMIPEGVSGKLLKELIKDKIVIHYTLERPWKLLCKNRLRSLYRYYLKTSPALRKKAVTDFQWSKLPALFRLRIKEFYYDRSGLQKFWKSVK
jgi:lipopolysaccharide biosynthesis glycosyltransferase